MSNTPVPTRHRAVVRRLSQLGASAAVAVASVGVAGSAFDATPAHAAAVTGYCTASRGAALPVPRTVIVDVTASVNKWRLSNGKIRVSSVSWSFSNPRAVWLKVANTVHLGMGRQSDVTVRAGGVTRYSTGSAGTSGTGNFADFDVNRGSQVSITLTPDVTYESDPTCTVYLTLS